METVWSVLTASWSDDEVPVRVWHTQMVSRSIQAARDCYGAMGIFDHVHVYVRLFVGHSPSGWHVMLRESLGSNVATGEPELLDSDRQNLVDRLNYIQDQEFPEEARYATTTK